MRAEPIAMQGTTGCLGDIKYPGLFHLAAFDGRSGRPHDCYYPHRHDFYEIHWITAGSGEVLSDLEWHPFSAGTEFFVAPGQIHAWRVREPPQGRVVGFSREFIESETSHVGFLSRLPFFDGSRPIPTLQMAPEETVFLDRLYDALWGTADYRDIGREDIVRAHIIILLTVARQTLKRHGRADPRDRQHPLVQQFRAALETNFPQLLKVVDYAELLQISRSRLNECIKRHTGLTASELIHERIELEAKRLLRHSTLTISEIAYRLQFHDPSYFVRFFKRRTAATPGLYRKASHRERS